MDKFWCVLFAAVCAAEAVLAYYIDEHVEIWAEHLALAHVLRGSYGVGYYYCDVINT